MKKKGLPFAIVVLGLLAIASAGIAGGDDSNPPGSDVAQISVIEPSAKEAMNALEGERTVPDGMSAYLTAKMDEHPDFGMNPSLSRLAIGNATHSVYLIPARGHVCASLTVDEGANITCQPVEEIASGAAGPATVSIAGGDIAIYGMVPDGVQSVSVNTGVADSTEIPTENNAYYAVVPAGTPLRTVSYEGPNGQVDFEIVDPLRAVDE